MKKHVSILIFLVCLLSFTGISSAQDHLVKIEFNTIRAQLLSVRSTDDHTLIKLPVPGRGFIEFKAIRNSTITDDFAAEYPEILSFDIYSTDDPSLYGVLTVGNEKLYACIASGEGLIGIWPSKSGERNLYKCYSGGNDPENGYVPFMCQQDDSEHAQRMIQEFSDPANSRSAYSSGEKFKTFKLVLICTGEFYEANGGNNNSVNTVITALVNSWNVILKKDLSIRLNLSQSPFLYTDKNTDPFIPDLAGGKTRTTQAVDAIHAKFSSGSYDIGHVLHNHHPDITSNWSSGGLAGVGVVCSNGIGYGSNDGPAKAAGWSGSTFNNDNEFVQLSIHEIGHQFNMLHTFNGTGESCTADNISETTAYEIGSGTTIMSYNGVCGAGQNIQPSGEPDNYYHINSLERAISFIAATTCGSSVNVNNIPPVVNAGQDYTIPKNSAFVLTGSATDANNDIMTYSWEQYDEDGSGIPTQGLIGSNAANNSKAPLFRSYPPSLDPKRYFPDMDYILLGENKNLSFEALPAIARTMKFRFTVRDNNVASGGVAWDENLITVAGNSGPFEITSQNTATTLVTDGTGSFTVKWNVSGSDKAPVSCSKVDIFFSSNGGKTFPYFLETTANDGEHTLLIPDYSTFEGRIMVKSNNNIFFDVNNADIKVQAPCAPEAATFTPTTNLKYDYNKSSNPNLDLNLIPAYGKVITKFSGSTTTSDKPSNLVYFNQDNNQCTISANEVTYDIFKFYITVSGSYTFENTGTNGLVINIYQGEYDEIDLCNNMIATNAVKPVGSPSVTISNSMTLNLTEGKTYYLRIGSFSSTFPPLPASYNVNLKTKPAGALMYDNIPSPGTNYFYTFLAYNSVTQKVHVINIGSDFRDLIPDFGLYYVKGVCVAKNDSTAFMQFVGKTVTEIEEAIYKFEICADFSSNFITIEIVAPKCDLSNVSFKDILCNDNSTTSDPKDDYITFTLLAHYGTFTDTFSFKHLDPGFITPDYGKFGTESAFRLRNGSAGNGNALFTMMYKKGNCTHNLTVTDPGICSDCDNAPARINEFNYEGESNTEFVEVYIPDPQPTKIKSYFVELYNGTNGTKYAEKSLDSMNVTTGDAGTFYVWENIDIQNGSPDGIALIGECGDVIEFKSYEGIFTASEGKAKGIKSVDVGVAEISNYPGNSSLQLIGQSWEYTVGYNTRGKVNSSGPCNIITTGLKDTLCNNNGTPSNPTDDYLTFSCNPIGNQLIGKYKLVSANTKFTPETADFGSFMNFKADKGTAGKGNIDIELMSLDSANCTTEFTIFDNKTCSPECAITNSNLSEIHCNENTTSTNISDDYLWFYLDPKGFNLSGKYIAEVNKGTITPVSVDFGVNTYFNLQPGSAGAGDVELTIKDINNPSCKFKSIIKDRGPCSPNATSDADLKKRYVTLFPNPADDILYLTTEYAEIVKFRIFNIVGRCVISEKIDSKIDVSKLSGSVYLIIFYDKNNSMLEIQKFVKK
ncbi:MAG: T9SS type A sorting domain-containing protein [Saprospiraceae bacterium]|nr:T9SS type A sorting domain-containing protein [Saprospiraceae bacterium]